MVNLGQLMANIGPGLGATGAASSVARGAGDTGTAATLFQSLVEALSGDAEGAAGTAADAATPPGAAHTSTPLPDDDLSPVDPAAITPCTTAPPFVQPPFGTGWTDVPSAASGAGQAASDKAEAGKHGAGNADANTSPASPATNDEPVDEKNAASTVVPVWIMESQLPPVPSTPVGGQFAAADQDSEESSASTSAPADLPTAWSPGAASAIPPSIASAAFKAPTARSKSTTTSPSDSLTINDIPESFADAVGEASIGDPADETAGASVPTETATPALSARATEPAVVLPVPMPKPGQPSQAPSQNDTPAASGQSTPATPTNLFKGAASAGGGESAAASAAPVVSVTYAAPHPSTSFSNLMTSLTDLTGAASLDRREVLPDSTVSQMVQSIRLQAILGGGEAHIRLEPSHLGELTVSIRVEQGQVVAHLQAESPVVREWLETNQGWLRNQLAEQQLTLDRFEVAEPAEPQQPDRRGTEQRAQDDGRQHRRPRPTATDEPFESFEVVA